MPAPKQSDTMPPPAPTVATELKPTSAVGHYDDEFVAPADDWRTIKGTVRRVGSGRRARPVVIPHPMHNAAMRRRRWGIGKLVTEAEYDAAIAEIGALTAQ